MRHDSWSYHSPNDVIRFFLVLYITFCHSRAKYWCWGNHHLSLLGKSKSKFLLLKCQFLLYCKFYRALPRTTLAVDHRTLTVERRPRSLHRTGRRWPRRCVRRAGARRNSMSEGRRERPKQEEKQSCGKLCISLYHELYHEANLFMEKKHELFFIISPKYGEQIDNKSTMANLLKWCKWVY